MPDKSNINKVKIVIKYILSNLETIYNLNEFIKKF